MTATRTPEDGDTLSLEQRRAIFLSLVMTLSEVLDLPRVRRLVAQRFGLDDQELRHIEQEGVEARWPPLGP